MALMAFVLPSLAQVDHDFNNNERIPVVSFNLTKDQIPPAILKAVNVDFDINNTLSWARFPFALQEYGWVYDKGATDIKLDRYEVNMKSKNGRDFYAIYSADGNLIESREMSVNVPVPPTVMDALSKSQYKDWTIVGDKEVIRYYHDKNNVEQHFRVTVEKDKVRRSISFNYQAVGNK